MAQPVASVTMKANEAAALRNGLNQAEELTTTGLDEFSTNQNRLNSIIDTLDAALDGVTGNPNVTFDLQENDWLYAKGRFSEKIWGGDADIHNAAETLLDLDESDFS